MADILDAAAELQLVIVRGRKAFDDDVLLRRAAERLLEIIGEAANGLSAATTERYPNVPWRDISRLRMVLAHHYHGSIRHRCGRSPPTTCRHSPLLSKMSDVLDKDH